MSFEPLNSFLNKIYTILDEDEKIKRAVKGVYLSINQNPTYPFIFIDINKTLDQSNLTKYAYSIEFNVSLFFREKTFYKALKIADLINSVLKIENFAIAEYKILGLKKQNIFLSKSEDTLTTKLAINYLSFIRQR